jgi:hypothetical protein
MSYIRIFIVFICLFFWSFFIRSPCIGLSQAYAKDTKIKNARIKDTHLKGISEESSQKNVKELRRVLVLYNSEYGEAAGNNLAVEMCQTVFNYYDQVIAIADTLEIDSDLIIQLNDLINLTAAKLDTISFQAKQQRTVELKKTEEIYTLVYRLIPCASAAIFGTEIENFINVNKLGGKELFELESGRKLKYYL